MGSRAFKSAGRAINPTRLLLPPMVFSQFGVGGVEERADEWCSSSVVPARYTGSSDFSFQLNIICWRMGRHATQLVKRFHLACSM